MSLDRDKLAKVLALANSDQEGESLNAMRMALRMLKAAGMRPEELAKAPAGPSPSPDRLMVMAMNERIQFWSDQARQKEAKNAELRASLQRQGVEARGQRKQIADLEARLTIATRRAQEAEKRLLDAGLPIVEAKPATDVNPLRPQHSEFERASFEGLRIATLERMKKDPNAYFVADWRTGWAEAAKKPDQK